MILAIVTLLTCDAPQLETPKESPRRQTQPREPRNHLLNDWLNVYVKDCVHLRGFQANATTLFRMLNGMASVSRLQKSIDYLLREGFWRKTLTGKIVPDENAVLTTSGLPVTKIRQFHKAALDIAKRGLDRYPPGQRKASATVISVDASSRDELRTLIYRFHKDLQDFIESHPQGNDELYQLVIHLTPIGEHHETSK